MTWDEFKKMVDDKLAEAGKDGSLPVITHNGEDVDDLDITVWNDSVEIR